MNCKPGDLAVYVGQSFSFRGEIYTVLRPWDGKNFHEFGPAWAIDHNGKEYHCLDSSLRPIRPDETPEQSIEAMRLLTHIPSKETA